MQDRYRQINELSCDARPDHTCGPLAVILENLGHTKRAEPTFPPLIHLNALVAFIWQKIT
jgi:hypothetical protein